MHMPELLAPAGSRDAMRAAVSAGANAVYLGAPRFNARQSAENFTLASLAEDIPFCHAHGVRVYVTLNTLLFDRELSEVIELASALSELSADASIVADIGAITALRRCVSSLPIHASTQAFAHSSDGVRYLASLGVSRAVVARELPKGELSALIKASAPTEIEVFAHGAHCVSYSGQCLFSSLVGGRSGNRGECAQPCRLPDHRGRYPLSLSDLSLAAHIPELCEMGVSSLKLEGRLKPPHYVYHVTRIFRRLLDEKRAATDAEMRELASVFSRSGFTDGYFTRRHSGMLGVRTEQDKARSRAYEHMPVPPPAPVLLSGALTVKEGAPITLTLKTSEKIVTVTGDLPQTAERAAMTKDTLYLRMAKMGNTPFALDASRFDITLEDGLFLPVSALNDIRRRALAALTKEPSREPSLPYRAPAKVTQEQQPYILLFETEAQYRAAGDFCKENGTALRFLSFLAAKALTEGASDLVPMGVQLPPVCFDGEKEEVLSVLTALRARGTRYAMIEGVGGYALAREAGLAPVGGMGLSVTNRESYLATREMGCVHTLLTPEVSLARARDIGGVLPIYGRMPLMLTERCYMKEIEGNRTCKDCGSVALTDRRATVFPMRRVYPHRCRIYNSRVLYMLDKKEELTRYGISGGFLLFSTETPQKVSAVLSAVHTQAPCAAPHSRTVK